MRRPPALELRVPADPAAHLVARGVQALALAVLTHWALAWAVVQWEVSASAWSLAGVALALGVLFLARRGEPVGGTWLRFDGEQWHWSRLDDDVPHGSGGLQVAARLGPWWLVRARAQRGRGCSRWIWLRPDAVRSSLSPHGAAAPGLQPVDGTRLRTLLNWS